MMQHTAMMFPSALAIAGAVVIASHPVAAQQAAPAPGDQFTCEEHSFAVTVGGRTRQATAHSCLHADGSLDVMQQTPGLPVQAFHLTPADMQCGGGGQSGCSGAAPQIDQQGCRSTSLPVAVDGVRRTATRRGCPQADGSWQVTQTVPSLPVQSYVVPANTVSADTTQQAYPQQSTAAQAYPQQPSAAQAYPVQADYPPGCYPYNPYYSCYPYYPYGWGYDPWFFGAPFFFGSVAIAFDNFHHSHHFDHFHDGNHAHFGHMDGSHFAGGSGHSGGRASGFSGGNRFSGMGSGGSGMSSGGGHFGGGFGGGFGGHGGGGHR